MNKNKVLLMLFFAILTVSVVSSCNKDDDDDDDMDMVEESIADDNTFADWASWTLEATESGPAPDLGAAHAGNDSTVTRQIYFKDGQDAVGGEYPVGTTILKHTYNPDETLHYMGMVKRGNDFYPDANNWEWFKLNEDGTIIERGAALNDGGCIGCHSSGNALDYVFSKN